MLKDLMPTRVQNWSSTQGNIQLGWPTYAPIVKIWETWPDQIRHGTCNNPLVRAMNHIRKCSLEHKEHMHPDEHAWTPFTPFEEFMLTEKGQVGYATSFEMCAFNKWLRVFEQKNDMWAMQSAIEMSELTNGYELTNYNRNLTCLRFAYCTRWFKIVGSNLNQLKVTW